MLNVYREILPDSYLLILTDVQQTTEGEVLQRAFHRAGSSGKIIHGVVPHDPGAGRHGAGAPLQIHTESQTRDVTLAVHNVEMARFLGLLRNACQQTGLRRSDGGR